MVLCRVQSYRISLRSLKTSRISALASLHPLCVSDDGDSPILLPGTYLDYINLWNLTLSDCVQLCVYLAKFDELANVTDMDYGKSWRMSD